MSGRILILGPPGAGKGTQALRLADNHNWTHISTGDIFRSHIARGTDFGKEIEGYLNTGELVPDHLACQVVAERLSEDDCIRGYILDGFPRSAPQAEELDKILQEHDQTLDAVIVLDVADDEIVERLTARRSCPTCGAIYNLKFNPPANNGVCDIDGAELIQREDDREDTIRQRLKVYHETTEPLVAYYDNQGLVHMIDGTGQSPAQITEEIEDILMNQGAL